MYSKSNAPDDFNSVFGDISELVKRWNKAATKTIPNDRKHYINGDIKLLFECDLVKEFCLSTLSPCHRFNAPRYIPSILAETTVNESSREVGDLFLDDVAGYPGVIAYWDGEFVLIEDIESMDRVEICVPSRFTVGLQIDNSGEELFGNPIGESIFHGFCKPIFGFAKWELNRSPFPVSFGDMIDDIPVSMIKSASQVVEHVTDDKCDFVYSGFVLFSECGSFSGLYICFKDIRERMSFLDKFVRFRDVFRGPLNLE